MNAYSLWILNPWVHRFSSNFKEVISRSLNSKFLPKTATNNKKYSIYFAFLEAHQCSVAPSQRLHWIFIVPTVIFYPWSMSNLQLITTNEAPQMLVLIGLTGGKVWPG